MFKNLHCSIGLINSHNLLIFKFRSSKFQILYRSLVPSKKRRQTKNIVVLGCSVATKLLVRTGPTGEIG